MGSAYVVVQEVECVKTAYWIVLIASTLGGVTSVMRGNLFAAFLALLVVAWAAKRLWGATHLT